MRRVLLALAAGGALGAAGFTLFALEAGGVAVAETRRADGSTRETHVWYAEVDGEIWLEAGTPENAWFVDVQRDPTLALRTDAGTARYVAEPLPNPDGHERIRVLLREKYGLRDAWIGLVFDTSRSVAVRLRPG